MPPVLRIPITNVYAEGDYTAQIKIGSAGQPANVLLDTGSSTLAINSAAYDLTSDSSMKPTQYAQEHRLRHRELDRAGRYDGHRRQLRRSNALDKHLSSRHGRLRAGKFR